jgi:hypothetical protein
MRCGDTLLIPAPGSGSATPHLWVIVTEPNDNDACIIVNLTTLRHNQDQTVSIMPGEHPFVIRPTSVRYSDALIADVKRLRADLGAGMALQKQPCSADLLRLIQDGISASPYAPNKIISFYQTYMEWSKRGKVVGCAQCEANSPVTHFGSKNCASGSLASGGQRSHCTCDTCF